jgi:hypothetical protein
MRTTNYSALRGPHLLLISEIPDFATVRGMSPVMSPLIPGLRCTRKKCLYFINSSINKSFIFAI